MEANLLAAVEPSALALGELQHGYGDQQPEADAREKHGHEAGADGSPMLGFLIRPASVALIAAVAAAQLVWVALLVYGRTRRRCGSRSNQRGSRHYGENQKLGE